MELWLLWIISGVIFFVIELFTPILFFLNLAFACLIAAIGAYYNIHFGFQIAIFALVAGILLLFLRPLLIKNVSIKNATTGLEEKYIGKIAKTILLTNATEGRITIYGEDWKAVSINGEEIPVDTNVKIIKNEGTVLFVEKI